MTGKYSATFIISTIIFFYFPNNLVFGAGAIVQYRKMQQMKAQQQMMMRQYYSSAQSAQQTQQQDQVLDLKQVMQQLEYSSTVWPQIMDFEPKTTITQEYIDWYKNQGIDIQKSAGHYVTMIDSFSAQNPSLLDQPFANVLKLMAIMEYDFDNGEDPDELARKVLDANTYEENRQRLGI